MTEANSVHPLKGLLSLLVIAAIIFAVAVAAYALMAGPLQQNTNIVIPRGAGVRGAATVLDEQGAVRIPPAFMALAYASGKAKQFKAGEYEFPAQASAWDIVKILADGKTVIHKFTAPEGYTTKEILEELAKTEGLIGDVPTDVKEGELLPQTYFYSLGDSRADIVKRMREDMKKLRQELYASRNIAVGDYTPDQLLTLASIVEEETGTTSERAKVAGVFFNRLRIGMKLQSDPTILYGLGRGGRNDNRRITRSDIQSDTPYNTYVIDALPPGPICNPGRASLEAVMHPETTDALYFVADGKGGHNFASSLDGHNKNVHDYLNSLKKQ